ncbi:MAG: winged helix-turn-helix transcriptional regulator [Clostridia bacterium]|nr:winged helix-turn-helix transcriptional regulator [Clostridia bacterium]
MREINDLPECDAVAVHEGVTSLAREGVPAPDTLLMLSEFFKIFGDPTRLSILFALDRVPMCVCDIAATLGMTRSAVSHQLKVLRTAQLVSYRREGKNVIYSPSDDHVRDIIEKALEHISE